MQKELVQGREPRFFVALAPWTLLLTKFISYSRFLRLFCKKQRRKGRVAAGNRRFLGRGKSVLHGVCVVVVKVN